MVQTNLLRNPPFPLPMVSKAKREAEKEGYPDFFCSCDEFSIIVEAKARNHESAKSEVQFYMEHNQISTDTIGIAVSGQTVQDLNVTYYLFLYGSTKATELKADSALLTIDNIEKLYKKSKCAEITTIEHLTKTLHQLNKQFQYENIVRDTERSLFFSGLMIALKDLTFRSSYESIQAPSKDEANASRTAMMEAHLLNEAIVNAITRQLRSNPKLCGHSFPEKQ